MKYLSLLFILVSLVSCAEKPLDVETAKKVVERLIAKADQGDWEGIEDLYTAEFNASETPEIKTQKLQRLRDTMGKVQSVEFVSATNVAEFGRPQEVILKYRVVHDRVTSIETFAVREDEGGYKVGSHMVESENNVIGN